MDEAAKAEHRDRIQALSNFINFQPRTITKFDGTLVRKLLKDVKVCDVFIEFRFKSGTSVIIEKRKEMSSPVSLNKWYWAFSFHLFFKPEYSSRELRIVALKLIRREISRMMFVEILNDSCI